jgi:septum formation protein
LLREILPDFEVVVPGIDEDEFTDSDPFVTAQRLAKEKALTVFESHQDSLVIAGDTVVALKELDGEWRQLTKPRDEADAFAILTQLQGRSHTVITGVCLRWPGGMSAFTESSEVTFKEMSEKEILDYIATGEPMDKAGAYGLQGGARPFITQVKGEISNVVGLPVDRLREAIQSILKR